MTAPATPTASATPVAPATPAIYECRVTHARAAPVRNVFSYRGYLWLVDLDRLPRYGPVLRWLAGMDVQTVAAVAGWVSRAGRLAAVDLPADTRRLGEIQALLAGFDWECDDRQYALEEIDRIVTDGAE